MRWLSVLISSAIGLSAEAGELAFVTNQNSSDLSIVDLEMRKEIKRVPIPGKAAGVAVSTTRAYAVSPDDATLRELSHAGEICRELKLDGAPTTVAIDEVRKRAFVSDWYNAQLYVVDLERMERAGELATGSAPSGVALSHNGQHLASADRDSNQVTIFDAESLEKRGAVTVGERPYGLTYSDDDQIYVTNVGSNSVSVVDPDALKVTAEIATGERPYGIAFAGDQGFVSDQYQDQLTVFDAKSNTPTSTISTDEYPEGIDRNQAQSEIYVANWFSNVLLVVNAKTLDIESEIAVGDGPRAFGLFVVEGSREGCDDPI